MIGTLWKMCNRRTDGQTDRRTDRSVLRATWSQLKMDLKGTYIPTHPDVRNTRTTIVLLRRLKLWENWPCYDNSALYLSKRKTTSEILRTTEVFPMNVSLVSKLSMQLLPIESPLCGSGSVWAPSFRCWWRAVDGICRAVMKWARSTCQADHPSCTAPGLRLNGGPAIMEISPPRPARKIH